MNARRLVVLAALVTGPTVLSLPGCGGEEAPAVDEARLAELRREHEVLHDSLEALVSGDSLLAEAAADTGEVVLAVRKTVIEQLIHEVTERYLDRVELNLAPEVKVQEGDEVRVKTFLGRIKAGEWQVQLTIHRIRGALRAKPPRVAVTDTNRIHLALPVVLEEGQGEGTIRFAWDAASVANVLCRDFETVQRIKGRVLPREYTIEGDFVLSAGEQTVVARPEFPEDKFRLSADLTAETWAEVQRTLESQDKIFKCGIALDPPKVIQQLRALGAKGFNIKLPRSIFRTVELPASVSESVDVENRRVALSVKPNVLRVTPRNFWYSAAVQTEISAAVPDTVAPADTLVPRDTLVPPAEREEARAPAT